MFETIPNHVVLRKLFNCDGPRKLSYPLTLEQGMYLEICVDSAFKTPYKTSSWADPYFSGMDNLKKWFEHHKEIKTARIKHRYLLKELAVYESVEDAENNLQCVNVIPFFYFCLNIFLRKRLFLNFYLNALHIISSSYHVRREETVFSANQQPKTSKLWPKN